MSLLQQIFENVQKPSITFRSGMSGLPFRLTTTASEFIDAFRQVEDDEDEEYGTAPVEVVAVDGDLKIREEPADDHIVEISAPDKDAKKKTLSKMPCEALLYLFNAVYGPRWYFHEIEVIVEDLANADVRVDAGGFNKVNAMLTIMRCPADQSGIHNLPAHFGFLACCLSGRTVRWDEGAVPSAVECHLALHILTELRPDSYSEDVLRYIAACCLYDSLWALPGLLSIAQPFLQEIADSMQIPLQPTMVIEILNRVAVLEDDPTKLPDAEDGIEDFVDAEVIEVFQHSVLVNRSIEYGEKQKARIWSTSSAMIIDKLGRK